MLELLLVFAVMCLVAVCWVAVPVLRAQAAEDVERNAVNVRIFQERLRELELDLQEARITQDEFAQLRMELEKTLLADADANAQKKATGVAQGKMGVVISLAILIPLLTSFYYLLRGYASETAEWLSLQERMNYVIDKALTGSAPTEDEAKGVTVADFIRVMQKKLQQEHDNPTGWMLLGVSYLQVEMPNEAQDALQRAYELQPQNVEIQMALVQATLAANGGKLNEFATSLLQQIMANYPNHPQALMVLGMASFNSGQYQAAIDAWEKLLLIGDNNSEGAQIVHRSIEMAKQRLANPAAAVAASNAPSLQITVNLDPALQSKVQPGDTLYVFAKAASGPPMPLAVHKQGVPTFPITVELNDSKAMNDALKLSRFPQVMISARISHSGQAIAQAGDLQGASGVIEVAKQKEPVSVTIVQEVQ